MSGFFLVWRDLVDPQHDLHPSSTGEKACRLGAWVDLIGMARWKDESDLKRGQLRKSVRSLADRWNWSPARVSRFLKHQRNAERITSETPHPSRPAIITICNYDSYQNQFFGDETGMKHERNAGRNTSGTHKERRKKNTTTAPAHEDPGNGDTSPFAELLPDYPPAVKVLERLKHRGTQRATVANLRTSFLYRDPNLAMPDDSVKGLKLDDRRKVVAKALVEMEARGVEEWSPRALASFVRRIKSAETKGRSNGGSELDWVDDWKNEGEAA